jgi:hypothetical protein
MLRRFLFLVPVTAIMASLPPARTAEPKVPEGFISLFNGKDLTGWQVNKGGKMEAWGAEDGVLFVKGGGGGWLMTAQEYGDFEVRLEYKLPQKGNSGVALRSPTEGDPAYVGMEIQILDNAWYKENFKALRDVQLTGAIYDVVAPAKDATKPVGEWNQMWIVAKGRSVKVAVNDTKVVDADLDDHKDKFARHPGLKREKGHLGLQSHDGRVEFRNLFVKPLDK